MPAQPLATPVSSPDQRPNGRMAACDPCRSRKVACDHRHPVCTRCLKRNQENDCKYSASVVRPSSQSLGRASAKRQNRSTPGSYSIYDTSIESEAREEAARRVHHRTSRGSTPSYSTPTVRTGRDQWYVLEESRNSLLLIGESNADVDDPELRNFPENSFQTMPAPLRDTCIRVLKCLPGRSNQLLVFHKAEDPVVNWLSVITARTIDTLNELTQELGGEGDEGLELIAQRLCTNTARPVRSDCPTASVWMDQFSGENIRWESIALLWVYVEHMSDLYTCHLPHRLITWRPGKGSLETACAKLEQCIQITRHFTEGNDVLLNLYLQKSRANSLIEGDAAMSTWETYSTAVAMSTYLGLHKLPSDPSYRPTFCSELRRRLACQVFLSDKLGVSFTGTPPLLSHRYFTSPMPLDITDAELLTDDPSTLIRVHQRLDKHGWNPEGSLSTAAALRVRVQIAFLRDEIMEMALGTTPYVRIDCILDIRRRQEELFMTLPPCVSYSENDTLTNGVEFITIYIKTIIYLEHLQNLFLIDRLLLKNNYTEVGDLLLTSFTMVSVVLDFWMCKDLYINLIVQRNHQWLVLAYAGLASGILCQEILLPSFDGVHPKHSHISHSTIIQNLSILVAFLKGITNTADADLCAHCRISIQRVLDHHLNNQLNQKSPNLTHPAELNLGSMEQPDFQFEILDTFDWMRPDAQ